MTVDWPGTRRDTARAWADSAAGCFCPPCGPSGLCESREEVEDDGMIDNQSASGTRKNDVDPADSLLLPLYTVYGGREHPSPHHCRPAASELESYAICDTRVGEHDTTSPWLVTNLYLQLHSVPNYGHYGNCPSLFQSVSISTPTCHQHDCDYPET